MGVRCKFRNLHILPLLNPDRSRHSNIPIRLGEAQIVVAVACGQGERNLPGHFRRRSHFAAIHNYFHLAHGTVGGIRDGGCQGHSIAHIPPVQHGAQQMAIQLVDNFQVAVFRGIDPAVGQGSREAGLRQAFRIHHSSAGICGTPQTIVVVLIIGGCQMPSQIQCPGVGLVIGNTFADHFHQLHGGIRRLGIMAEVFKIAVERAKVVELAHRTGNGVQGPIVFLQRCGEIGILRLIPALETGSKEGGNMPQTILPGHFIAIKGQKITGGGYRSRLFSQAPFLTNS